MHQVYNEDARDLLGVNSGKSKGFVLEVSGLSAGQLPPGDFSTIAHSLWQRNEQPANICAQLCVLLGSSYM